MENDKNNKRNDNNKINTVVANRPRQAGRHYKLSAGNASLAFERMGQPYVDRAAMSARAVISTATVDRVGDVLVRPLALDMDGERDSVVGRDSTLHRDSR